MSEKIPHEKTFDEWCGVGGGLEPIELTGKVKVITTGGKSYKYYQVQRRLFGFKMWKSWLYENNIEWHEPTKIEIVDIQS